MISENPRPTAPKRFSEVVDRVKTAFLILDIQTVTEPLEMLDTGPGNCGELVCDAVAGLKSVVSAATMPFQLAINSVHQRRFDRFLSAEQIRSLAHASPSGELSEDLERKAAERARSKMAEFLASGAGRDFVRDAVVEELDRSLASQVVSDAAKELMIQALVSTWAVFEHFVSEFIVDRVNANPHLAKPVLAAPELKAFFGKQAVDFQVIDQHGYDLTRSMGSIIFRNQRLDSLAVVRSVFAAMFDGGEVQKALGKELWLLNQRRHLLVHRRGLVDREYLDRTGDDAEPGQRLVVTSKDVERYLMAVQKAIVTIKTATTAAGRHLRTAYGQVDA